MSEVPLYSEAGVSRAGARISLPEVRRSGSEAGVWRCIARTSCWDHGRVFGVGVLQGAGSGGCGFLSSTDPCSWHARPI